jgi:hypothetical protein
METKRVKVIERNLRYARQSYAVGDTIPAMRLQDARALEAMGRVTMVNGESAALPRVPKPATFVPTPGGRNFDHPGIDAEEVTRSKVNGKKGTYPRRDMRAEE